MANPGPRRLTPKPKGETADAALAALAASGALDGVEDLSLTRFVGLTDLSPLTGLERLAALELGVQPMLRDLSPLGRHGGIAELSIHGAAGLTDLSGLATLPWLTELELHGAIALTDLSPLAGLTELTELSLRAARSLTDLSPLGEIEGLTTLDLSESIALTDLSGLERLAKLAALDLSRTAVSDLSALAGLEALASLSLSDLAGVDLSPLAGRESLRELSLTGAREIAGLEALRGLTGLVEGLGEDGRRALGGRTWRLSADERFVALQVDDAPCGVLRQLDLAGCDLLTDLEWISQRPEIEGLDLRGCTNIRDLWPLIRMESLARLEITATPEGAPKLKKPLLAEEDLVQAYRNKLALALKRVKDRTPAQDALLAEAKPMGLLTRKRKTPEEREREATLKQIRRFISAGDRALVQQGYELVEALDDPALIAELARGISIQSDDVFITEPSTKRSHLRRRANRATSALYLARLSGQLEGVTALHMSWRSTPWTLAPLEGLAALESLSFSYYHASDLEPLNSLPALRKLSLQGGWYTTSIEALSELTGLTSLKLENFRRLEDFSPLLSLAGLTELDLSGCYRLPYGLHAHHEGAEAVAKVMAHIRANPAG